ncbi:7TM diverse intracellular signaling domain-containing protein [Achromobacter insolitus]|uniref:sensor histidine kinase n=1 Tax=Achromobacter insolitus TaxID=217204 RepID=UPI0005392B80|nr:7TM diverse intracellular signaling domain-containing protein [Achromobacter insolitus]APX77520.1 ATP-binding protein [Achromobacter insolitus]AVG42540.1 ATP-binding protein [Achromobacter insolitus]MCP1399933.1 signal transduction histidine kinase [Achromobacter insolitus]MDH3067021.1 7TM diverse intracellular signaling domain-containing protein [Achromobacter insolitus]OAE64136.1 histidine kinase [Achromobacter insolitus]
MKWLAVLWLALWLAPAWAQEPAGACTAQVSSVQVAKGSDDGRRPDAAQWQAVQLPDDWSARWPGYSGTAWYRIGWRHDCHGTGQVALALESVVMAGEVYINDQRIWSDAHLTEPLSRSWNMPRYWLIPDALVGPGENTLWIRVVGVAGQSPGLGPVHLGGQWTVLQLYEDLWWRHRTLFTLNLIVSAVLGGLCFCIWLMRREQRVYGWYALMALFWVLFIANVLMTSPWPFPNSLMAARANIMVLVLYVACFCIFTWRFGGQSLPRVEKALWVLTAALLALEAFVPQGQLARVQLGIVLIVSGIFFANCLQFPLHALRTRKPEHGMLAVCLLVFLAASAHDLLRVLKLIDTESTYTPFTSVVVTLCMSAVLGLRHARNVRRIERFNQELADGIDQARTELATTLEREHTLALANARLQDRLQIAHDLHDGLGGSLVRMMAMVEQASTPVHSQQFLSMLKLLRDDLRQTIDSGSSAGIKVPATPREWIAPLRHRFMQLFDELDLQANWRVPEQWLAPPSALQCMALTRLVEESLANVLKHSRARRVEVALRQSDPDSLELRIEDDGAGFDVAAVLRAGISVGMRSMHTRIARVGGQLNVASRPGQTVLTATLALRAPQGQALA